MLRNVTLRKASRNVALGERMARKLSLLGVAADKIRIIPNWADGALIRPVAKASNLLRCEWGLSDAFVIGYSGNLGRAHDFTTFLSAIIALEGQDVVTALAAAAQQSFSPGQCRGGNQLLRPKLRWLFIGGGMQMQALKAEVEKRGLKSVVFKPYQPRERLSESLSVPDVHLISLKPELEGLVVPSKYYGIAAAGRPAIFIGDTDGEIARIIGRSGTGLAVREGDGPGLVLAIEQLADQPWVAEQKGARARALFETGFDFPIALKAWMELIGSCTSP